MCEHPWVRIPLSPPDFIRSSTMQKYPSGRRGSPAKGVGGLKTRARVQIPPSAPMKNPVTTTVTGFFLSLNSGFHPLFYPLQLQNRLYIALHAGSAGLFHLVCHMAIHVESERCGSMAQIFLYCLNGVAGLYGHHGIGVP